MSGPDREAVELFLQEASEHLQYLREYVGVLQEITPKREDMETAVRNAKAWISAAIAEADRFTVGHGHGPIHHFHKYY